MPLPYIRGTYNYVHSRAPEAPPPKLRTVHTEAPDMLSARVSVTEFL